MEFTWDRNKAERNRRKHDVTFDEAVTIFFDPRELVTYDPDHSMDEERYVSIGMSVMGRLVVVGYTERGSTIRLIFARRATPPEWMDYEHS
ncbi:MAG: BrnT family toxin [Microbacteriaceae bacterium]